jgi:hypothetical protein
VNRAPRAVRSPVALLSAVAAAAAFQEPVQQPALAGPCGRWLPLSRALEPLGVIDLGRDRIAWSICRGATARQVDAPRRALVFAIEGEPGCVLDGRRLAFLTLAPRAQGCAAELSLFSSAEALHDARPEAWGLVEREGCR